MKKIRTRVLAGGLASVALIAGVGVAIAHDGEPHPAPSGSLEGYSAERTVTVRDRASGEVVGMAMVRQRGRRLLAKITVAGLEPGSAHANHLHGEAPAGPPKGCFAEGGHSTRHIHDLPDLVANSAGVAYATVRARVDERVLRPGAFWMVHRDAGHAGSQVAAMTGGGHGGGHSQTPSASASGHANPGIACAPLR